MAQIYAVHDPLFRKERKEATQNYTAHFFYRSLVQFLAAIYFASHFRDDTGTFSLLLPPRNVNATLSRRDFSSNKECGQNYAEHDPLFRKERAEATQN